MEELNLAIKNFVNRSKNFNQIGKNFSIHELDKLQKSMNLVLPKWYTEMMLNGSIANIEFEYKEYEDDDYLSGIEISNYPTVISEIDEAYPGIEIKPYGYVNFGTCLNGSGDPIFINLLENTNPPVLRVYHDYCSVVNGKIVDDGKKIIANKLSDFLNNAIFNYE